MKNIKNIFRIACLMSATLCILILTARAQSDKGTDKIKVSTIVVDEQGDPVVGAAVYNAAGSFAVTNEDGGFELETPSGATLVIEKDGYASQTLEVADLAEQLTMPKLGLLLSEQDLVNVGFSYKKKRDIVGAVTTITPSEFMKYDNTQWAFDAINGRLTGVIGSQNVRGLGDAMIVVDGIPGRFLDILNMEEIEEITVLKDANAAAMYGAMGRNGVIVITTKRGKAHHKDVNVNVNYGVKDPISFPKFLGSADYMTLFNEARANDGTLPQFTEEQIENYRFGDKIRYPDIDYYSSEYIKPRTSFANVLADFTGGSENTQYYVSLGYKRDGSIINLNPDVNAGGNQFNVRGNIDFKVNDWIKSSIDIVSVLFEEKSALSNILSAGTTRKPYTFSPLLPLSYFDTVGNKTLQGQLKAANLYDNSVLGVSNAFRDNTPIASAYAGGYQKNSWKMTQFNNAIDFDLGGIAEGLSAKTYLSFDFYNYQNTAVRNEYSLYEPTWAADDDKIIGLTQYGRDRKDQVENISNPLFVRRMGFYGTINYDKQIGENHRLNLAVLGFANSTQIKNVTQVDRFSHLGWQLGYTYKDKLMADFSGSYVHSIKLPDGNRNGLSPTLALAYVLSEEAFMQGVGWLDYLKIRGSAGRIYSDIGISGYYLYDELYDYNSDSRRYYEWGDAYVSRETLVDHGRNFDFDFEERLDFNIGLEAFAFNKLWVEWNMFRSDIANQQTRLYAQYPSFYTPFIPYSNYNTDRYSGTELGITYKEYVGELAITLGGRFMYTMSQRTKVDEIYENDYQNRQGTLVTALWGLEDRGFYSQSDFDANGKLIESLPQPAWSKVQPGDIKYIDQNKDGQVNDQDMVTIGDWRHPVSYGADMKLEYKNFTLFALFTGMAGGDALTSGDYFWVDGQDKYSEVVLDRWTPETASTATFPRLTSGASTNNFRNSTFWLYDNSYFKIQRAQLTYLIPQKTASKILMKSLRLYVAGSNLLEISQNADLRQLNIGGQPQYRYYSVGLRAMF
ncbi:MAG: SusC/RagA family TonB-linked outer membrane protein [Cyclobacteriaceae bacterium]|nr:SusC/RagA family TonB-linked outer membrane protein [Cyclobacteriaceae bacterium]